MRRHLILTLAIMIALTTILSAPIGSGPTPACAKQQFEQPEKTFDGDPEVFDTGLKPGTVNPTVSQPETKPSDESPRWLRNLFKLLLSMIWSTR
jgi:hypothetical protein